MTTYLYACFGLLLRSNMALPCIAAKGDAPADVEFHFEGVRSLPDMPGRRQQLSASEYQWRDEDGNWHLRYRDVLNHEQVAFAISACARRVTVCWTREVVVADIARVVLGPVCGRLLQWQGKLALHGNAVRIDDAAVLFCAQSGGGKSTTSAALVAAGYPLVCDDIATLDFQAPAIQVEHGYPHLRLWPDSAMSLGAAWQDLPTVFQRTITVGEKCYRDLRARPDLFCAHALPLRAIYLLGPRCGPDEPVKIEAMTPRQAFGVLFANLYLVAHLTPDLIAQFFPDMGVVANRIPVFSVQAPDGLAHLENVVHALAEHARQLGAAEAPAKIR